MMRRNIKRDDAVFLALGILLIVFAILLLYQGPAGLEPVRLGEGHVLIHVGLQGFPGVGYTYQLKSVTTEVTNIVEVGPPASWFAKNIDIAGEHKPRGAGVPVIRVTLWRDGKKYLDSGYIAPHFLMNLLEWVNPLPQEKTITAYVQGIVCDGKPYKVRVEMYDERGTPVTGSPYVAWIKCS